MKPRFRLSTIGSGIYVTKSGIGEHSGRGLFASNTFERGEVITVYDGIIVFSADLPRASSHAGKALTHAAKIPKTDCTILGLKFPYTGRGGGSFANHSSMPNSHFHTSSSIIHSYYESLPSHFLTLCLQATDRIHPNTEITVKYCRTTCERLSISY